jgi:hypothetical protein
MAWRGHGHAPRGRDSVPWGRTRPCFFVLCNRRWFNRVPESSLGIACLPSALTLTLAVPTYPGPYPYCQWVPQSTSGRLGSLSLGVAKTKNLGVVLPGQDRMGPFGMIIGPGTETRSKRHGD